jgi:dipeptidase E
MKLILTGGGESSHFEQIDQKFISMISDNPTLLYVPLAQDADLWEGGLSRIQTVFSTIDFESISLCKDLNSLTWDVLKQFGGIYIDGGNTFKLMGAIRHTHTFELLHRFLHNGGVINGDSAGAIILGSHLETAHMGDFGDSNDSNIVSYQGLNLIGKYAIHAHYEDLHDKELYAFSDNYGFPIICLYEETGICIEHNRIKTIGQKAAVIISDNTKKVLDVGAEFEI